MKAVLDSLFDAEMRLFDAAHEACKSGSPDLVHEIMKAREAVRALQSKDVVEHIMSAMSMKKGK